MIHIAPILNSLHEHLFEMLIMTIDWAFLTYPTSYNEKYKPLLLPQHYHEDKTQHYTTAVKLIRSWPTFKKVLYLLQFHHKNNKFCAHSIGSCWKIIGCLLQVKGCSGTLSKNVMCTLHRCYIQNPAPPIEGGLATAWPDLHTHVCVDLPPTFISYSDLHRSQDKYFFYLHVQFRQ